MKRLGWLLVVLSVVLLATSDAEAARRRKTKVKVKVKPSIAQTEKVPLKSPARQTVADVSTEALSTSNNGKDRWEFWNARSPKNNIRTVPDNR